MYLVFQLLHFLIYSGGETILNLYVQKLLVCVCLELMRHRISHA